MARTVVGLFNSAAEAHLATGQLLAAGFERGTLSLATEATLRAEHLPAAPAVPAEPFEEGVVRFFTHLFAGSDTDAVPAYIAATHPDSAVLTVSAATEEQADRARRLLDASGAIDVYKQAVGTSYAAPTDDIVDLEGRLSRVRDSDELDANGLTTH